MDQMEANLLTKAAAWKHDAEWRVIDTNDGPGYQAVQPYPPHVRASHLRMRAWFADGLLKVR